MKRAVVTGIGLISPLACGAEESWKSLLEGKSGAGHIEGFQTDDLPCRIACAVPRGEGERELNPDKWIEPKEQKRIDDFIIYAIIAADMAMKDSGFEAKSLAEQERSGVLVGSGIGGLNSIAENTIKLIEKGPRKISPFFIPGALINLASGQISIRHNLKGPNSAVVTACSTGAHAIGDAARLIQCGEADMMLAGGTEAAITRLGIAGFAACRALSTNYNDTPELASRPWDKGRDGFVMGEGCGTVVIEEYEKAKARGAKIYAEIVGYGMSGDAYHVTSPSEDGDGGYRAMKNALASAGLKPEQVDYINAHGTSTPLGDVIELRAIERLFEKNRDGVIMSSTKSSIGHLLGAAGAVEAVISLLAIRDNMAPPTINLENPEPSEIDLVPQKKKAHTINIALSNSFGFGGTNASLIFKALS